MNRPIDKVRNSAIRATLPPDTGGISDMCEINGDLHMIGNKAIYRVQLADQIDPQRTNINVPDINQRVLPYGTEFPFTRKTLMQARRFFSQKVLGSDFDDKAAISQAFEALHDFAAMFGACEDIRTRQEKIEDGLNMLVAQGRNLTVPTIGSDMRTITLSFLHRANHCANALYNIAKLFYGDALLKGMFDGLHAHVLEKLGKDDQFPQFLEAVLPFLKFIRNARNAVEHPKAGHEAIFADYALTADATIFPPMIEIKHPETAQVPIPLWDFMQSVTIQLGDIFEIMLAHLAGANVQLFAGMPLGIMEYDENMQKAFKCRYGYCSRMGDRDIPFG